MNYYLISIAGAMIVCLFSFLIYKALGLSEELGNLGEELEDEKQDNQLQEEYLEISSRPSATADELLKRMRGTNSNGQVPRVAGA